MPNGTRARPNLRPDHNGTQRAHIYSNMLYEKYEKALFLYRYFKIILRLVIYNQYHRKVKWEAGKN